MSEFNWYYAKNGQQLGPVSQSALADLIRSGQLAAQDLVWREGMPQWAMAASLPELQGLFAAAGTPAGAIPTAATPLEYQYAPGMLSYAQEPQYAGFWLRFAAFIIDWIVLIAVNLFITAVLGGFRGQRQPVVLEFLAAAAQISSQWLYYALMESSSYQVTLGKMALGLKVTDLNGQRISFGRASGRYFGKILSGLILCIGFLMIGFTQKKQGLHDMLADTLVVKK